MNEQPAPPVDLRYLKKPRAEVANSRSSVISFLTEVYTSIAETLPDFRDDAFDVDTSLSADNQIYMEVDPYTDLDAVVAKQEEHKHKPKNTMRSCEINSDRVADPGGPCEERWLPPGQMKDFWELYKQKHRLSSEPVASFATFWRETPLL